MANIDLSSSSLQRKQTIFKTKNVNNTNHEFGATLYLEEPRVCQINCVSRADYSTHLFFE